MALLTTKLHAPRLRPERVSRPRLIQRLTEGRRHAGLTLICAPAGYGKTTLAVDWLTQLGEPFAWLSLDEADNDPVRVFSHLIAALQRLYPDVGHGAHSLLTQPQAPPLESVVVALLNDLDRETTPGVVVLDDYHLLRAVNIQTALASWLEQLPPHLHVVALTREDPPFPLARWRVRGHLTEVRAADLRFTVAEADDFLQRMLGPMLSTPEVTTLAARTEGWIAGLQLAALSLRGRDAAQAARFIETFSGSHRYVIEYLADEVLQQLPPELRSFLHETAILDRLCAPLCEAVTGRADSRALLAQVEQANLFLISLDDHGEWYRYHHLLADFLRAETDHTLVTWGLSLATN